MRRLAAAARVVAAGAVGACLPLAFAPYDWHGLAVVCPALLFLLGAGTGWRRAALIGWAFGLGEFGYGVHWIFTALHTFGIASPGFGVFLDFVLCSYLALFPAGMLAIVEFKAVWRRSSAWLLIPGLWLLGELLRRSLLWGGFPWFSLGYSALGTPLERLGPILGCFGISAVLIGLALAFYRAIAFQGRTRLVAIAGFGVGSLILWGLPKASSWTLASGAPVRVSVIQAGVPMDEKYDANSLDAQMANYRALTEKNFDAQLIIWPEAALPPPLDELGPGYLDDINLELRDHKTSMLIGTVIFDPPDAERPKIYASAVAFGASSGRYDKRHLVPFGEFIPVPAFLRPYLAVLGTPYDNITRGADDQPDMVLAGNHVDVSICYEDVYGSEFRQNARASDYLINLTDDAWYGQTNAAIQHLDIARMRALEYGREMVRSTSTGFSAFIDADGILQKRSGLFTMEALRSQVRPRTGTTPFAAWGDWPLWMFGWASLIFIAVPKKRTEGESLGVGRSHRSCIDSHKKID